MKSLGKTGWSRERGEQKWNLDISLIIKERIDGQSQETAKGEKSMKVH